MLLYNGKQLSDKTVDNPSQLGKKLIDIMLICLNGGPKFLTRLISITKLTSAFLFDLTFQAITSAPNDEKLIM